ncbi:MAG: hypothetical protein ACREDR_45945 [Blastocatellia bacterium]
MRRDLLDPALDVLFDERLTDPDFIQSAANDYWSGKDVADTDRGDRLHSQLTRLQARRNRVLGVCRLKTFVVVAKAAR